LSHRSQTYPLYRYCLSPPRALPHKSPLPPSVPHRQKYPQRR